jgi:GAF domain-containing protein
MHDATRPAPWTKSASTDGKPALYRDLAEELDALLTGENDATANAANAAAAIYHTLPRLNWAGFYFVRDETLLLGPFQGRPACVRIAIGSGVCGTAARERRSILVPDVETFPGHIACDTASRSELVVPLIGASGLIGVLDLDSPDLARFDAEDQAGCEALAAIVVRHLARSVLSWAGRDLAVSIQATKEEPCSSIIAPTR